MSWIPFHPIIPATPDGFIIPEVEWWEIQKYKFLGKYLEHISKEQLKHYDQLVYLDLFAGSGLNRLTGTDDLFFGSPLIALASPVEFTKYIFCEKNVDHANALRVRVNKYYQSKNVSIFPDDVNTIAGSLELYIPGKNKKKVFILCLIDAFSLDISYKTLKALSELDANIICYFAFPINSELNIDYYRKQCGSQIEAFLNNQSFLGTSDRNETFLRGMAKVMIKNMEDLGYQVAGSFEKVESDILDPGLVYWVYFSKIRNTNKIWSEVRKQTIPQMELFG